MNAKDSEKSYPRAPEAYEEPVEQRDLTELTSRLQAIIRSISGKPDLMVTTKVDPQDLMAYAAQGKNPRTTWYRTDIVDSATRKSLGEYVHIPDSIFEPHEDVAKGKAAHEAGHVAITRSARFVPDEVLQELGFHGILAASEERATDQMVRERFPGAGEWVDAARKDNIRQEAAAVAERNNLGYMPKSLQLNGLVVHGPHYDAIPAHYDPDIVELYHALREEIELAEKTLPQEGSEEETMLKAKERYAIVYQRIWPKIKHLVAEDLETEELRQMLEAQSQGGKGGEEKPQMTPEQEAISDALEKLSDALKQELEQALEEMRKAMAESDAEEEGAAEQKDFEGEHTKESPESSDASDGETQATQEAKGEEQTTGAAETRPYPVPMHMLSERLLDALKKAFDRLPNEVRELLARKAREALEELEDEFVRENSAELVDTPAETHEDYRERMAQEEREQERARVVAEEKRRIEEAMVSVERRIAAIRSDTEVYDRAYQKIRHLDEQLYRELEEIFTPNIKRETRLAASGAKINLPALFRREASRAAGALSDSRIFETLRVPATKDYAFTLLNDLSGSMAGEKIEQDFKAKILLTEILNRLGLKNEILGFQDEVITFKTFDETLTDEVRKKMSGMLEETANRNPGGHNHSGHNDDGPCLLEASRGLAQQEGKEKFLIVVSDGWPNGRYSTAEDLTLAVKKILRETDQKLVALGLGPGTEHVTKYYPTALPNITVEQLADVLGELLKDMILYPEKYSYRSS